MCIESIQCPTSSMFTCYFVWCVRTVFHTVTCVYSSVRAEPPLPDVHKNMTENAQRLADLELQNAEYSTSPIRGAPNICISNSDNKVGVCRG